jgi:hypothetical protein
MVINGDRVGDDGMGDQAWFWLEIGEGVFDVRRARWTVEVRDKKNCLAKGGVGGGSRLQAFRRCHDQPKMATRLGW